MEISFSLIRSKDVVNIFDGKRLGRATDIVFDASTGKVLGIVLPGVKKMFKKNEDIFVPIEFLKKIGDDVILVKLTPEESYSQKQKSVEEVQLNKIYARYRRVPKKEM
ncbi:MAG: YlmC/YmxH family sporulation protein [Clostridia bacterium]|nr:YlmC/YmxH family sporulation protein [Clostridia bacterium]